LTWYTRDVTLSESAEELVISRQRPRGVGVHLKRLFIAIWIVGWAVAEYETARLIFLGPPYKSIPNARLDPEIWAWFLVWTIIGFAVLLGTGLLLFAGPETVRITSDHLMVSTQIGWWTRRWQRPRTAISNLRIEEIGVRQKSSVIKVDYSGSTLAVLPPSDRESTRQVFEALKGKFDQILRR
jgi:hypothetical protein